MPIPGTQEIRRPLLEAFKGEAPRNFSISEFVEIIAEYFGFNLNDFSSGDKNILRDNISKTISVLKKRNLLYNPSGNTYMITNAGTETLEDGPEIISNEYLKARRKKPLPLSETLGAEAATVHGEPEVMPERDAYTEISHDTDTRQESVNLQGDDPLPGQNITLDDDSFTDNDTLHDTASAQEAENLSGDDPLPGQSITLDDDSFADNDTLHDTASAQEAENLSGDDPLPEQNITLNDSFADNDTLHDTASAQQAENLSGDDPLPKQSITLDDSFTDNDTTNDTASAQEAENLSGDDSLPKQSITLDDSFTDNDTTNDTASAQEAENLSGDDPLPGQSITLDDSFTDNDTLHNTDSAQQAENLSGDDPLPDNDIAQKPEVMPENDSFAENYTGQEFDETPEEISDTEEEYKDTMPEDTYEPQEIHEDLTPEPEAHEETEPEEEYNPALLAAAMHSDTIDDAIARHNSDIADQLLMKAAGLPPDRFEMLVIDLLSKMGYFAFQTARYTSESSGNSLIHGVILDNETGANIYIQARKLSPGRTVSKADIQDFIDELSDKGGKGIFATTASFSENAKILAADERIMLIDGEKLANLMIANNFCVNVEKVYEIKAVDTEAFSEYE